MNKSSSHSSWNSIVRGFLKSLFWTFLFNVLLMMFSSLLKKARFVTFPIIIPFMIAIGHCNQDLSNILISLKHNMNVIFWTCSLVVNSSLPEAKGSRFQSSPKVSAEVITRLMFKCLRSGWKW